MSRRSAALLAGLLALTATLVLPAAGREDRAGQSGPPVAAPLAPFTLVVDPGHGGDDHGAVGATGVEEKALVLSVAQRVQSLAASREGVRVRLTREDDRGLTLDERATAANRGAGGLFVSLHANFSPSPKTAGAEVGSFRSTSPGAEAYSGDPAARGAGLIGWNQAQLAHAERASVVAQRLLERLRGLGPIGPRSWYQAQLKPLAAVNMPAVLVEIGYLSNADDEAALVADERQNGLAQAVLDVVSALTDGPGPAGVR